jgi:hypothetical protein
MAEDLVPYVGVEIESEKGLICVKIDIKRLALDLATKSSNKIDDQLVEGGLKLVLWALANATKKV